MAATPTTQRAYTLRLSGISKEDNQWRQYLWNTHEAVNKGAKAFGDWLLTLRGGLSHTLAKEPLNGENPTEAEIKNRQIILALSWLSVEDEKGALDAKYRIASGRETRDARDRKVVEAFKDILKGRKLTAEETQNWMNACEDSLKANIREDAVWINRSKIFNEITNNTDEHNAREDCRKIIWHIFGDNYLDLRKDSGSTGAGNRTRQMFTNLFGESSHKATPVLKVFWAGYLKEHFSSILQFKNNSKNTEMQREMFSKAASRMAGILTKRKQQELERQEIIESISELIELEHNPNYAEAFISVKNLTEELSRSSGARQDYVFSRVAIQGWDNVVKLWKKIRNEDEDSIVRLRQETVRELQSTLEDRKIGDVNLFCKLANKEYESIWLINGQFDSNFFIRYCEGIRASYNSRRLKIASFRHPDQYFNPVFCEYGKSRPQIDFSIKSPAENLKKAENDLRKLRLKIESISNSEQTEESIQQLKVLKEKYEEKKQHCEYLSNHNYLKMHLCKEDGVDWNTLRWQSKRARSDLFISIDNPDNPDVELISRNDRLSRASQSISKSNNVFVDGLCEQEQWNGRLQAPRKQLKLIGKTAKKQGCISEKELSKLTSNIDWFITFSVELKSKGPWYQYIENVKDKTAFYRTVKKTKTNNKGDTTQRIGDKYVSYTGWPYEEVNKPLKLNSEKAEYEIDMGKNRGRKSQIILSRLSGLRVLSVDLGHRYAAACAVWQVLSKKEVEEICENANRPLPKPEDIYLHISNNGNKTILRRIGADEIVDMKKVNQETGETPMVEHPGPWAKLDRQFLIKLQGEKNQARKAKEREKEVFKKFRLDLGFTEKAGEDTEISERIDELMFKATRLLRWAIQRHGKKARISYNLITNEKILPGDRPVPFENEQERVELLQNTLTDWWQIIKSEKYDESKIEEIWIQHIRLHDKDLLVVDEGETYSNQKVQKNNLMKKLASKAEELAKNETVRRYISEAIRNVWQDEDTIIREKIKELKYWILPRGKNPKVNSEILNVGGLSLTRITTIQNLRKAQIAFYTRLTPTGRQTKDGKPVTAEEGFSQKTLDTIDHLREQRVKQLASRLVEAALGIGTEKKADWEKFKKRPRQRINKPQFAPCHSIVIENLTNYRPDELRTRRVNRQLMQWSSSKVKKYLAESCELNGLHLREVVPNYTSRQDSRTGAPGVRCNDLSIKKFLKTYNEERIEKIKIEKEKAYVKKLYDYWKPYEHDKNRIQGELVRIPQRGGEIFVSAYEDSPLSKGIQADLNAAANIGLRALLDPDWKGAWWYIPCKTKGFVYRNDKTKGSYFIEDLRTFDVNDKDDASKLKTEYVNLWNNLHHEQKSWTSSKNYWLNVHKDVVDILERRNTQLKAREDEIRTPW